MGKVWRRDDLNTTEKMVLLSLADYSNIHGHCWPAVETLAQRCSIGDRQVRRIIKKLEADGLLIVKNRGRRSNYYILDLDIKPDTSDQLNNNEDALTGHFEQVKPDMGDRTINEPPVEPKRPAATKTLPAQPTIKNQPKDHTWFTAWWCFAYQQIVGEKYAYQKKDAGQIKQLLSVLGLIDTTCRACSYLTLPAAKRFPRGSPTLGGLLHQINEVSAQFDRELEERFISAGLLPDMERIESLKHFQPWSQKT